MIHLITSLSKYLMIILMAVYAIDSYAILMSKNENRQTRLFKNQTACLNMIHLDAYLVIFCIKQEYKYLLFYLAQVGFILLMFLIYRIIYKKAERLLLNTMCMLMVIGFIILTRLDFDKALKQFEIAAIAVLITCFIPQLVRKFKALSEFTWIYGAVGILALGAVFALGRATGGAKLSFSIAGITLQPSEFVKIIFVFFIACMLTKSKDFKNILITTIAAAVHVLILVISTDLGAALIFFVTYLVMLYAATRNVGYFLGGFGLGAVASVAAAKMFSHVRTRIEAWKDPFANITGGGYQVAQAMFAIGTGGWVGLGLFQGVPETIPVAASDFVFAALVEETGILFGIALILICLSMFLMCLNVATRIHDEFYKLIALGLGCVYGTQVFLNIGGVTKCIPSTGVTLPFISYGGSSILCSIVMFAIIQGLFIMRQDEGEAYVRQRSERETDKALRQEKRGDRGDRPGLSKEPRQKTTEKKRREPERRPEKRKQPKQESSPDIKEIW